MFGCDSGVVSAAAASVVFWLWVSFWVCRLLVEVWLLLALRCRLVPVSHVLRMVSSVYTSPRQASAASRAAQTRRVGACAHARAICAGCVLALCGQLELVAVQHCEACRPRSTWVAARGVRTQR